MRTATLRTFLRRWALPGMLALSCVIWSGCAIDGLAYSPAAVEAMSPPAQVVGPLESYHLAQKYVAEHPGAEIMIGSGDSMMPLYKDHTVIITEPMPFSALKPGMTVVFVGASDFPVAHVLVGRTFGGWTSMGVGNRECDSRLVDDDNYMGVVVKAFEPTGSPMLALIQAATSRSGGRLIATNP